VVDLTEHQTRGGTRRQYSNYANYLVVLQSDDTTGEYVIPGQKIDYSGNTGFSSLSHLHFAAIKLGLLTSINHCLLFLNNSQG
jgi:murein DD-endopeptidase MepM/ murein hydrolase activator NlpD